MSDIWTFGPVKDSTMKYADETEIPHRSWVVFLNEEKVGEIDVHMHRRKGPDGITDTSFGFTPIVYGNPQGGK
jgi:hypothetical protein